MGRRAVAVVVHAKGSGGAKAFCVTGLRKPKSYASEAMALVRKMAGVSHPELGRSMGHHLLDLTRTWVATHGATQPTALEVPKAESP